MIDITLEEARELYNQGSLAQEIALRAFSKEEIVEDYKQITSLPTEIDCRTERLYARLVTAYKQMSKGREVKLTKDVYYIPEIVLTTAPSCGDYKGRISIDDEIFYIYTRVKFSSWKGRLGFIKENGYGNSLISNAWAFKERGQAQHFVDLFYKQLIYIYLGDMYQVTFLSTDFPLVIV